MSNLSNALDELRSWATRQQAILSLAAALEGLGSLENAAAEAQAALDAKRAELEEVSGSLVQAKAKVLAAEAAAESVAELAAEDASALAEGAKAAAAEVQARSEENAVLIIEAANEHAKAQSEDAAASVRASLAVKARIEPEVDDAVSRAGEATKTLEALNANIAAARDAAAKFLSQ